MDCRILGSLDSYDFIGKIVRKWLDYVTVIKIKNLFYIIFSDQWIANKKTEKKLQYTINH